MREIALIVILIPLCAVALFRPLIGLYTYTWYALLRPDVLAYIYERGAPYSSYIAAVTLVGMVRQFSSIHFVLSNPIALAVIGLQLPLGLSHLFAEIPWRWSFFLSPFGQFEKMILMCIIIPALVITARQLWWLVLIMGGSLGLLGSKFGLFGLMVGGANFSQGYGGFLSDNNDIALAFAMTIPLLWCLRRDVESRFWRLVMLFAIVTTFAGIVMTHSRTGAVTLGVILLILTLRSKRKVGTIIFLVLAIAPAVYLVRDSYLARIETLENPTEEGSAMSRITLAKGAIETWKQHPFLGVGFGGRLSRQVLTSDATDKGSVVHNTYLQMLADSGIFAALAYVGLLWGTILWLEVSRRRARRELPHLANIPEAIQISLIAFAVGSMFLSRVQFDFTYMLIMAAATWQNVYRGEMAALSSGRGSAHSSVPAPALEAA